MTVQKATVGARVIRKSDGASGVIVCRQLSVPCFAHPGIFGKTLVSIRLDNPVLRSSAGGDMTGDLSWLRSYFRAVKEVIA